MKIVQYLQGCIVSSAMKMKIKIVLKNKHIVLKNKLFMLYYVF